MNRENEDLSNQPTGRLLVNAFRCFEKELLLRLQGKKITDITLSHLNVIRHLNPEGMKLIELARDAALTKQAISKICSNLSKKGYISIISNDIDARAKSVAFTKKGARLIEVAIEITREMEAEYIEQLGEKPYKQLRSSLNKLTQGE